jgi:hypothetical protein
MGVTLMDSVDFELRQRRKKWAALYFALLVVGEGVLLHSEIVPGHMS